MLRNQQSVKLDAEKNKRVEDGRRNWCLLVWVVPITVVIVSNIFFTLSHNLCRKRNISITQVSNIKDVCLSQG